MSETPDRSARAEVVVVGGGYAGVVAANRLTGRDDVAVTLVNPRPEFVERIRLHQFVAGTRSAVVDYAEVLASRVRLVVDTATRIDAAGRRVTLAGGATLSYDYLVYAVGSSGTAPDIDGSEYVCPIATLEDARRLAAALEGAGTNVPVAVVGAGPTGIETAAELADQGRSVTLACGDGGLGPYLHPRGRRAVARRLVKLGVDVVDGPGSTVTEVTSDAVHLADGRSLRSAVTIWAAGFRVPDLARRSGLSTDDVGRLRTDETLTSLDDARIVAAGDPAAPSDLPVRMSCQAAGPLGAHAADTILHRLAGDEPGAVAVGFVGQCLSLGRRAGVFQVARRDDTARGFYLGGRIAAVLKEQVCRGTVTMLEHEAAKPGWRGATMIKDRGRQKALAQRATGPVGAVR